MKRYTPLFKEELLDGFVKSANGQEKSYLRKIESKKEYDTLLQQSDEPRGIIYDGNLYLITSNSFKIIHSNILDFLHVDVNIRFDTAYDADIKIYLTVQVLNKKVYIGESYTEDFKNKVRTDKNSEEYKQVTNHFKAVSRLGIPYKIDFI